MVKRRFLTGFVIVLAFLLPAGRCLADVSAQLAEAKAYAQQGEYEQAEALYRQVAADNAGSAEGLSATEGLILVLIRAEKKDEAQAVYRQLMADYSASPGLVEALSREAAGAFKDAKMFETAAEIYEYILAHGPSAGQIMQCRTGLFKSYLGLNEDVKAQAEFDSLVTDFADQANLADIVENLGKECRGLRKWQACRMVNEYFVSHWGGDERAANAQRLVAKSCLKAGDDEGATAAIEKLLADYSGNPGIGYELAELADDYAGDKRYEKAAGLYKQAVERWPSSKWAVEAQKRLARMYIHIGDYEKADSAAGKLTESFSNAEGIAAAIEDVADKYQLAGSHAKSYPLHRYVVEHWPENERAIWCQMKAIMSQLRLSDLAKAEQDLGSLLTDFAGHKELGPAVHEVVEEYRNTGAHEEGRELFAYLLENWDETPDTMLELQVGIALQSIKLREPNRVEAAIEQLIADYNDHPKIAKALFQIAEEFYYAHKYDKAIELMELILSSYQDREYPGKGELPFILALCQRKMGRYDEAIKNLRVCVEEYPESRFSLQAPYSIGLLYLRQKKDYEQAAYWFEQQLERYPNNGFSEKALHHLAWCYLGHLKDYVKAAQAYEEYIANYPDDVCVWSCYTGLARCYAKLGDADKALGVLQSAYEKADTDRLRGEFAERITALEKGGVP
ncbi:MAG TPA: tetratricopeptide repeat protein [Sedimentisphaerales bacterium]|nr:tetratricopeptide repeat protein [Sedimentisphaerales bacterium]